MAPGVTLRRRLSRAQMLTLFEHLPPCLVGMEACGSAHHWARAISALGHDVRLISPAYVKPYVKRSKTDAADAAAICAAVSRLDIPFVPVKSPDDQALALSYNTRSLIARAAADHDARLIVFPQFGLSGHALVSNDQWVAAAIEMPGPEIDRIAAAARKAQAHVVIQAAERHSAFPGRYFLSAALVTPEGTIAGIYRKHYTLSLRTSPIDVHDAFVATFGTGAFFPVCDTPIGRIGMTIGAEVHWPEVTRSLALKGAEIIVNPIAAVASIDYLNRPGADYVRPVRAFENMTYLAVANIGGIDGAPRSQIYDYEGGLIGQDAADDSPFTLATTDLERLRAARAAPGANLLAQLQPSIHQDLSAFPLWPSNIFAEQPAP